MKNEQKNQNKCPKGRTLMYTQQVDHCPYKTVEELANAIEHMSKPPEWYAVILHDKDVDEKGNPVAPHFHLVMMFKYARSPAAVAAELQDQPQYVELWHGNSGNAFSYLCHKTREACMKHQYDPKDVKANFDYPSFLVKQAAEIAKTGRKNDINLLLDKLFEGKITRDELIGRLSGSEIAKYNRDIETVDKVFKALQAAKKCEEMRKQGKPLTVIWIYGEAGSGKTRFAKEYAKRITGYTQDSNVRPYFISGSSRDPFQGYQGERVAILDELRAEVLEYPDLLRILDPYGEQVNAPSRFYDKTLACDTIIITTPFSPIAFYRSTLPGTPDDAWLQSVDTVKQLQRRITYTFYLSPEYISVMVDDSITKSYENPFSKPNTATPSQNEKSPEEVIMTLLQSLNQPDTSTTPQDKPQEQDACPAETESARGNEDEGQRKCG